MSNTSSDLQRIFANQRDMRESFIKQWISDVAKAKSNNKGKRMVVDVDKSGNNKGFEELSF